MHDRARPANHPMCAHESLTHSTWVAATSVSARDTNHPLG
jgi:hypothetical protein